MSQQTINLGAAPNDGTGDTLRVGGAKINANFTEMYTGYTMLGTMTTDGLTITMPFGSSGKPLNIDVAAISEDRGSSSKGAVQFTIGEQTRVQTPDTASGLRIDYTYRGGSTAGGQHAGISSIAILGGGGDTPVGDSSPGLSGGSFQGQANQNWGPPFPRGGVFGIDVTAILGPNIAGDFGSVIGQETDVGVYAGTAVDTKIGLLIAQHGTDKVQGTLRDAALAMYTNATGGVGWKNLWLILSNVGQNNIPIDPNGVIIQVTNEGAPALLPVGTGIDFSACVFSGFVFKSRAFEVIEGAFPTASIIGDGNGLYASFNALQYGDNTAYGNFTCLKGRGSQAAPTYPLVGDFLGNFGGTNFNNLGGGELNIIATENHNGTSAGTKLVFQVTPNTTTTVADAFELGQDRSINISAGLINAVDDAAAAAAGVAVNQLYRNGSVAMIRVV